MQSYAIVKTGGKQYTVSAGDIIKVELFPGKTDGDTVELETLMAKTDSGLAIGEPALSDKVTATILNAGRAKKITILKRRKRSTFRKKNGHRQGFHAIRIESIPG